MERQRLTVYLSNGDGTIPRFLPGNRHSFYEPGYAGFRDVFRRRLISDGYVFPKISSDPNENSRSQ